MDESKIIIIGVYGQLGKALQKRFPGARAVDRTTHDITNWDMLNKQNWSNIDVILNAAAFTNVDGAETSEGRKLAWQINAQGPSYLARLAIAHNITLVHVSSEYVFDGTHTPHTEDEPVTPLGVYAQSKAAGDIAVSTTPKHYIVRTSWLIGDGPNFVRTMIDLAHKNISPTVVADQIGRLTFTDTLVDAINHLLTKKAAYGIYNVSNDGEPANWADITREIFKDIGYGNLKVIDTTTNDYFKSRANIAPRPLQSTMDLSKIKTSGIKLNNWQAELKAYAQNELKEQS